jgi:hypothetical protein
MAILMGISWVAGDETVSSRAFGFPIDCGVDEAGGADALEQLGPGDRAHLGSAAHER